MMGAPSQVIKSILITRCIKHGKALRRRSSSYKQMVHSGLPIPPHNHNIIIHITCIIFHSSGDGISCAIDEGLSQEDTHESYCPLTLELKTNTFDELLKQIQTLSDGKFDPLKPFCITGLHTCGDLAANVLRLFLQSPAARAICVIGCCYHQISESEGIFF